MHHIHCLLVVILFFTTVFSTPIQNKKRSFKVKRVEVPNYVADGPKAYFRALSKYGINDISALPNSDVALKLKGASLANLVAGDENGRVSASPTQNDAQFLSPVTIGGQNFIMNFDSGSSDTWVFNTNLNAASIRNHRSYDPKKSKTAKTLAVSSFNITYGDSSFAGGPVGLEEVDIGGSTVKQQAIGLPNLISRSFSVDTASDGLVGLGFTRLNTMRPQQQKTFFDNVMPDLSLPVFSAQLKHGEVGAYEFGNIDRTAFTGELTTIPVDSRRGFWEVASELAIVNNNKTISVRGGSAVIDTGTSLILAQNAIVTGYWNQVPGAQFTTQVAGGGIVFPCDSVLPDLQLRLGDKYLATVFGSGMNFANTGLIDSGTRKEFCFGGLQSNGGLPFSIYGDVFFKSQFVVFNGAGPSLGVAPHA